VSAWKYRALLASLLGLVVLYPLLGAAADTRLLLHLFFTLVFFAALLVVFIDRRHRVVATVLGVPTVVGLWTGYFLPDVPRLPVAVAFHVLASLFFAFTILVVLGEVFREKGVTTDSVCGALCGYVLMGLVFGHFYNIIELQSPGSFRGDDFAAPLADDRRHYLLTYFSFITLTTVGFGDISPGTNATRGLAAVEAILGQFYIAVLVATIIGKRIGREAAAKQM
jgi:hypothetical protein